MSDDLIIPVVAGLAIGIAFIITFAIYLPSNNGHDKINSVETCGQRLYIPTPGGKVLTCPAIIASHVDITRVDGFPACLQMYSKDQSYHYPATYDFTLKPNSTGYMTVIYDFGENEPPKPEFFTEMMKASEGVNKLNSDGNSWIFVPANQTSLTVSVATENMTKVNPTTLKVTYKVETSNTMPDEIGNTYLINIYQVCTGELITIGEKPYTGRLPLD